MAVKFQGGKAVPMNQPQFDKLEYLRKKTRDASAAVNEAVLASRGIGTMNNWGPRLTEALRLLDAIERDIYKVLSSN